MDELNPKNLESFDKIETVDLQVEMARSYLDYAMSVIVGRALPDTVVFFMRCMTRDIDQIRVITNLLASSVTLWVITTHTVTLRSMTL